PGRLSWPVRHLLVRVPLILYAPLQLIRPSRQVAQERLMFAPPAVRRLPPWHPQIAADARQVKVVQQRPVVQAAVPLPLLRVAGELQSAVRQVARPGLLDGRQQPGQRLANTAEYVDIRWRNLAQRRPALVGQHQAVAEAARPEQHRTAAAGPSQ